jgi:hypothetical protein
MFQQATLSSSFPILPYLQQLQTKTKSMRITATFLLVAGIICFTHINAQTPKIPQPSTLQTIQQDFGLGQITVAYSRPNVKGRKIFGETEPYGLVWRTGANAATRITLTDTIMMEKHPVVPGEYALFTIPGAKEWTVILNQTSKQWGAYNYDSTKDVLRFKVKPEKLDKKLETFTIQFANAFVEHCELQLLWENTLVTLHLDTDIDARVMANIDELMKAEKKPYYSASIYYYNHDKDMNKTLSWINEADKNSPNAYNIKYWKAKIQLKSGDKAAAIASANEGLKLAMAEPNAEYIRLNKEVLTEAKK